MSLTIKGFTETPPNKFQRSPHKLKKEKADITLPLGHGSCPRGVGMALGEEEESA